MNIADQFSPCDQDSVIAIIAKEQTAPIGRTGKWINNKNQIICSLIFSNNDENTRTLLIKTAVAIHQQLVQIEPESKFDISYPNDIYKNNVKLCGILQVCNDKNNIIGFGINQCQPPTFKFESLNQLVDIPQFVTNVINKIVNLSNQDALQYYTNNCIELQEQVLREKNDKRLKILSVDFPCTAKALNIDTQLIEFLL